MIINNIGGSRKIYTIKNPSLPGKIKDYCCPFVTPKAASQTFQGIILLDCHKGEGPSWFPAKSPWKISKRKREKKYKEK